MCGEFVFPHVLLSSPVVPFMLPESTWMSFEFLASSLTFAATAAFTSGLTLTQAKVLSWVTQPPRINQARMSM